METISFILGIAFVVVIATAIVAVYAFVKVGKVKRELDHTQQESSREYENIYRIISEEARVSHDLLKDAKRVIHSDIDSRFDKLENKLNNKK